MYGFGGTRFDSESESPPRILYPMNHWTYSPRFCSSVGQNIELITRGSSVQARS